MFHIKIDANYAIYYSLVKNKFSSFKHFSVNCMPLVGSWMVKYLILLNLMIQPITFGRK